MKKFVRTITKSLVLFASFFALVICSAFFARMALNKPIAYGFKDEYFANHKNLSAARIVYGKAKQNCYLFKTSDITDSSFRNVLFIVPETYFVTVLDQINSMICKVEYKNRIGYVSVDSISIVNFVPSVPTLENITFDIPDQVGTQIRVAPVAEDTSNILKVIPASTKSIQYIATIIGEIPTGGTSNIWYYCLYTPSADPTSVYEGYVYSGKTQNLSNIPKNTEAASEIPPDDANDESNNIVINDLVKGVLIALICIPIVLIFILLVSSNRKKKLVSDDSATLELKPSKKIKLEDFDQESNSKPKSAQRRGTSKTIKSFEGKPLKKKEPVYSRFISDFDNTPASSLPKFPTYEIIDDDDLL